MHKDTLELEPQEQQRQPEHAPVTALAVPPSSPAGMLMTAAQHGYTPDQVRQMMELQERWEANEARKAFNAAFSAFKAEAVRIVKNKEVTAGPLAGKTYAELHAVVDAVVPALSRHGLSHSWSVTKDEKDWIEVTCTLEHVQGHAKSVSMGGPPDSGGAKNPLQARASTKSYLERYTLKAICGVAEGGEDDDGNGGDEPPEVPAWLLQEARDAALQGWKHFAAWIKSRSAEERELLEPESDNLKAAAKQADRAAGR